MIRGFEELIGFSPRDLLIKEKTAAAWLRMNNHFSNHSLMIKVSNEPDSSLRVEFDFLPGKKYHLSLAIKVL